MTDFADCPTCEGDPDKGLAHCPTCAGSSRRPLNEEAFELAETAADWAMEHVSNLFHIWCELTGRHPAYGVESFSYDGDVIRITQDVSAMGCHDTQGHSLPSAWLFAAPEERAALIKADLAEKEAKAAQDSAAQRKKKIAGLQAQLARLTAEDKA